MICLDFDGVLFDTANEAFEIGCQTFFEGDYDHSKVNYNRFLLLRPFVDSAWQYRIVFNLLIDDLSDDFLCSKGSEKLKGTPHKEDIEFAAKFNNIRTDLLSNNLSKWLDLNKPYDFFQILKPLMIKFPDEFRICSTKSSEFIFKILSAHGVNLDTRQIWGRDIFEANNSSKAKIIESNTNEQEDVLFVDDSPRHIKDVQYLANVNAILAKWGYLEKGKIDDNHLLVFKKIRELLVNYGKKN
jgi:hypothetical protein